MICFVTYNDTKTEDWNSVMAHQIVYELHPVSVLASMYGVYHPIHHDVCGLIINDMLHTVLYYIY